MLKINIEYRNGEYLYNLLFPIYRAGGFDMKIIDGNLVITIEAENSVKARQILNSILRLTDTAERLDEHFKI